MIPIFCIILCTRHALSVIHGFAHTAETILGIHVYTHHILIFRKSSDQPQPPERDFSFVERPSEDFFCPVTYGLVLQPHLTACCGKHLSQDAATRIQGGGGACPLCNEPHLNTMLDKRFRRQVNELRMFCCHEDRGCRWQGELSDLERHVQSCLMKTAPLMTDILKLPV